MPTDDPRDLTVTYNIKDVIAPEILNKLYFDQEKMKKGAAEMPGFTAPDVVGKIAPKIKPGKYTCKDVAQNPAFKDLFPPDLLEGLKKYRSREWSTLLQWPGYRSVSLTFPIFGFPVIHKTVQRVYHVMHVFLWVIYLYPVRCWKIKCGKIQVIHQQR